MDKLRELKLVTDLVNRHREILWNGCVFTFWDYLYLFTQSILEYVRGKFYFSVYKLGIYRASKAFRNEFR